MKRKRGSPEQAVTPTLDVGAVVEIPGYGRRRIGRDELTAVDTATPPVAILALGTVFYLRQVGYLLVEEDVADIDSDAYYPTLTPLDLAG